MAITIRSTISTNGDDEDWLLYMIVTTHNEKNYDDHDDDHRVDEHKDDGAEDDWHDDRGDVDDVDGAGELFHDDQDDDGSSVSFFGVARGVNQGYARGEHEGLTRVTPGLHPDDRGVHRGPPGSDPGDTKVTSR